MRRSSQLALAAQQHEASEEKLPYRPDLWHDQVTGEATPHRAALSWLYHHVDLSDDEAAEALIDHFEFFNTRGPRGERDALKNAFNFVQRNHKRVEAYHRNHEFNSRTGKFNYTRVLFALKSQSPVKLNQLVVFGFGRGADKVRLGKATVRRHLQRAQRTGLITVDHEGTWKYKIDTDRVITLLTLDTPIALPKGNNTDRRCNVLVDQVLHGLVGTRPLASGEVTMAGYPTSRPSWLTRCSVAALSRSYIREDEEAVRQGTTARLGRWPRQQDEGRVRRCPISLQGARNRRHVLGLVHEVRGVGPDDRPLLPHRAQGVGLHRVDLLRRRKAGLRDKGEQAGDSQPVSSLREGLHGGKGGVQGWRLRAGGLDGRVGRRVPPWQKVGVQ